MAEQQQGCELDRNQFCCPVCLDLLKEPVTLHCGHSYCISCIGGYWDQYEKTGVYSCPQCRESFSPRPVLRKNTLLAEVVMTLSSTGAQHSPAASAAPLYAGPADVACDFCTGARRRKALMTCLTCLASYCETHLQPHYNVPVLQTHKLVPATNKLQEKMCSSHNKLMEVFCRTDRQCICYLCTMDEHKGHDTVSAAAEKAEEQKQLVTSQEEVQQKIQEKKKELKDRRQVLEDLNSSAEAAVEASDRIFSEMMVSIERRLGELKQLIRDQQQNAVAQTEALLRQLEQTLEQLERRHAELEELSNTEDITTFIQSFQSLSSSGSPVSPSVLVHPLSSFTDVTDVVSALRDKLDNILKTTWPQIAERAPDPKDPESPAAEPAPSSQAATSPRARSLNSTADAPPPRFTRSLNSAEDAPFSYSTESLISAEDVPFSFSTESLISAEDAPFSYSTESLISAEDVPFSYSTESLISAEDVPFSYSTESLISAEDVPFSYSTESLISAEDVPIGSLSIVCFRTATLCGSTPAMTPSP